MELVAISKTEILHKPSKPDNKIMFGAMLSFNLLLKFVVCPVSIDLAKQPTCPAEDTYID